MKPERDNAEKQLFPEQTDLTLCLNTVSIYIHTHTVSVQGENRNS